MDHIISQIEPKLIKKELNRNKLIKYSKSGNNEIYILNNINSPNTINEIGRLREITFRNSGGGIGTSLDIDDFDLKSDGYNQLIVWDPSRQKILGGYRFRSFPDSKNKSTKFFTTGVLFKPSNEFTKAYLPYCIDLGRAFIIPTFQTKNHKSNIFILDNIWEGLGALTNLNVKYFIGRIILYPQLNNKIRDLIIYFMDKHFNKNNNLLIAKKPFISNLSNELINKIFKSSDYHIDYLELKQFANSIGETIPPLIKAYMKLSPTLQSFGVTIDPYFGNLYEICIMITIKDIYPKYQKRYQITFN